MTTEFDRILYAPILTEAELIHRGWNEWEFGIASLLYYWQEVSLDIGRAPVAFWGLGQ